MIVQLISVVRGDGADVNSPLVVLLGEMLAANQHEADDDTLLAMVRLTHERSCPEPADGKGPMRLVGFEIELPEEVEYPDRVMDELIDALQGNAPFTHAVRFEDDGLWRDLTAFAEEIFSLEMKLRRALTFVYLHAYANGDPFSLLVDESVKIQGKEQPKPEQMRAAGENQFFHLIFSQYRELNKRATVTTNSLWTALIECADLNTLKAELARQPVEDADDQVFLAGLISRMNAVEAMRNCVAHNRRPPRSVRENYQEAAAELDAFLDQYLATHDASSP